MLPKAVTQNQNASMKQMCPLLKSITILVENYLDGNLCQDKLMKMPLGDSWVENTTLLENTAPTYA